jgi:hypothetical protein
MAMMVKDENYCYRFWTIREGKECRVSHSAVDNRLDFWDRLDHIVKKGQMWWVFGWRMYASLCKAGIYEIVDQGGWDLLGGNNVERERDKGGGERKPWGALCCEDIPTIIDLRTPSGGKIRFVDLANYGLRPSQFLEDGESESLDTATQAVQDYFKLLDVYNMGSLKTTAASQSYCCYRTHHMKSWIFAHDNEEIRKLERSATYSGRAEAFRLGKLPGYVYHVDVQGMYNNLATVMSFPRQLTYNTRDHDECWKIAREEAHNSIARVTVSTDSNSYPCRCDGRVIYPAGEFETCLAGPELVTAIAYGRITAIHELAVYRCGKIFDSFANWYFRTKDDLDGQGLGHLKPAFKLMGNTLYGKIGSRGKNWVDYDNPHKPERWGQWFGPHERLGFLTQYRAINGRQQYLDGSYEPATSCPAISAFMNSYGRVKLQLLIETAGRKNVHYVDTDGLMLNHEGWFNITMAGLLEANCPGKLIVKERGDDVEIFGIKHYRFGDRVCCAGAIVSEHEARAYMSQFVEHTPFEHSLQHRTPFDHSYQSIRKSRTGRYNHGKLQVDGSVTPHYMQPTILEYQDANGSIRYLKTYQVLGSAIGTTSKSAAASAVSTDDAGSSHGNSQDTLQARLGIWPQDNDSAHVR